VQAPGEQAVIERAAKADPQRLGGTGRRDRQRPAAWVDVAALFAADVVPPIEQFGVIRPRL
jgi:hypothetical protein